MKQFSLLDRTGHVVRAWRVTSKTTLWLTLTTPSMLGRDLVVTLDVSRETQSEFQYEHLILRLGSAGGTRASLALDPHAIVRGLDGPITALRVGPDGHFYQLRMSPKTGVSITRYPLDPQPVAPPKPTPTSAGVLSPSPTPTPGRASPPSTLAPHTPTPANLVPAVAVSPARASEPRSRSRSSRALPLLGAVSACAVIAVGLYTLRRRRDRVTLRGSA